MRHYSKYKHNRKQYRVLRAIAATIAKFKARGAYNTANAGWWNHPCDGSTWTKLNNSNFTKQS